MPCQSVVTVLERGMETGINSGLIHTPCAVTEEGLLVLMNGQIIPDPAAIVALPVSATIAVDGTEQISCSIDDGNDGTLDITDLCGFASANELIATVSEGGVVLGIGSGGPISITVSFQGLTDTVAITVS